MKVRGRDQDPLVDASLGVTSLKRAPAPFAREPILVLTHAHLDHMGSAHEFAQCWAHREEPVDLPGRGSLHGPTLAEYPARA